MNYEALFARILDTVDDEAYLTPSASVDRKQRSAVTRIGEAIQSPNFDAEHVRALIERLGEAGHIDRVMALSALHVVACHPRVKDWEEAARLVGEQEFAALELGGPNLANNLASVDRHRGVLAFMRGHYEVALDYFARALERQRSAENLQNILATLLRLGDENEALDLLKRVRTSFPTTLVGELNRAIDADPDLALLRTGSEL
jgi:tetratricopeptide (TPR) repeat protein